MSSNVDSLLELAMVSVTTYLLHSTMLLGGTWVVVRGFRIQHNRLRDRLWKLAAVAALITTPLQLGLDISNPALTVLIHGRSHWPSGAKENNGNVGAENASHASSQIRGSGKDSDEQQPSPELDEFGSDRGQRESNAGNDSMGNSRSDEDTLAALPLQFPAHAGFEQLTRARSGADQVFQGGALSMIAILLSVVVIAGLFKLTWETLAFRRRLGGTELLRSGPAKVALDRLLRKLSIHRSVQLLSSKNHREPAAFGVLRWRIVLPEKIEEQLRHDELSALLAHELAHLMRGDTCWLWVGRWLCSCCAFQPLNFLARREWRCAAEFECDDWAVRHGVSELSLARCLTQVAAWKHDRRRCAVSLPASGSKSNLTDRVERLVEKRHQSDSRTKRCCRGLVWIVSLIGTISLPCWAPRTVMGETDTARDVKTRSSTVAEEPAVSEGEPSRQDSMQPEDEIVLWHSIALVADDVQTQLSWLEQNIDEMTEILNESHKTPDAQAFLGEVRAQLDQLNQRRGVLDVIGRIATNKMTDRFTDSTVDVP